MGGAVSAGEDNDNLVDNLVKANYIRTGKLIEIFRAVDRGHYYLKGQRSSAYHDIAWKFNHLHLSAPCIYSEVMEHLDLRPGMSFLNLGSGTGYLSTMAALVLGANGINHGIEIHADVVEYATDRLKEFMAKAPAFDRFEFCEPKFVVGNCLLLPPDTPGYDRVYCGAACPPDYASYLMNLLNIGGKLVLPLEDQLQVKIRTGEQAWESENALSVSFANLITPDSSTNKIKMTRPPERTVPTLQDLSRFSIRRVIREVFIVEMPPKKKKKKRHRSLGPEAQVANRRKMARRLRRRRMNTTGGSSTRHLRRRRNTTGDSDHVGSSDESDQSSEDDSDGEVDIGITDIKEEAKMVSTSTSKETKESSLRCDLANDTKDISLEDEKDASGDKKNNRENSAKGETSTNHSRRSHFRFVRRRHQEEVAQEVRDGPHTEERSTAEGQNLVNTDDQSMDDEDSSAQQGEDGDRQLVRSLRSGRLVYALMRGLTRLSREQETNEAIGLRSAIGLAMREAESRSEETSDNEADATEEMKNETDSDSDSDNLYKPLPETPFTLAIRKLPLPQQLVSFLLYHRQ